MSFRDWRLIEERGETYAEPSVRKAEVERRRLARRRGRYQHILVVLQGRGRDGLVLDHVPKLARQLGAKVTLLRVILAADDSVGDLGRRFQAKTGFAGLRRSDEAEAYLGLVERQLWLQGQSADSAVVVCEGSEADEIVRYSAENGFDMIAMAGDSRAWYERLIGGNPANEVQRKATLPTLLVGSGTASTPTAVTESARNPATTVFATA